MFEDGDLIILGGGAAGMTAAITAAAQGLKVLLIEKTSQLGGTTALSAGSIWVPNSHYAPAGADSIDDALRYMEATVGNHAPSSLKSAFLERGPEMLRFLAERSDVTFRPYAHLPDYFPGREGATLGGRALETVPFDGRLLGRALDLVRLPLPEFTVFNGMMVDRTDIHHLLNVGGSLKSMRHTAHILMRHGTDRLRHARATRLVMGNALVARMLSSMIRHDVAILASTSVDALVVENGRVAGVRGGGRELRARRGVVLATGGFSHDPNLRASLLPSPIARFSAAAEGNSGDGIRLGLAAGARIGDGHANSAFWAPSSVRRRADGSTAVFPHFVLDRGKPGLIAVDAKGRRFVNESTSYQAFVEAMYRAGETAIPCFFICDRPFLQRYGLGMIRPRQRRIQPFTDQAYLFEAPTIAALAGMIKVDPHGLADSVDRNNRYSVEGVDPDFGKGGNAYNRNIGDPTHGPNPCLGPIATAPFYAIEVHPADIGTSAGLVTDEHSRVLDRDGAPVPGLYAAGNDMHSVMGGVYPGPGATIGPAMTFGYVAAAHASAAEPPNR